jgi:hypothetical protein
MSSRTESAYALSAPAQSRVRSTGSKRTRAERPAVTRGWLGQAAYIDAHEGHDNCRQGGSQPPRSQDVWTVVANQLGRAGYFVASSGDGWHSCRVRYVIICHGCLGIGIL